MRVLVTGAGGLLGGRLAALLSDRFDVTAARHVAAPPAGLAEVPLDLVSLPSLEGALRAVRPDAVLHAASLADADRCESNPQEAREINVRCCERLAKLCRASSIRLVSLSTDLVLGGQRAFSAEAAPAEPCLLYGRTKLEGEEVTLVEAPGAVVARVALVLGRGHGPRATASEAIAWALREGRRLRLFTDQFRTPVDAESVAKALATLLQGTQSGRFHLGGPERLSRYDLGLRVARTLGLPAEAIEAVRQADASMGTPRPADASLDTGRARRELGWEPRPVEGPVKEGRPARI